ncbi:MAG: type III-A CRISPR-associated RAMP protein Csm5 [Clostridia bacterium]|nr:type III-A CRISPR-associated RAMP protein Csm5 [Clostridia bacterium]
MIVQDHLQVYELKLVTQGPLFIGSGEKTPKKEFIYNARKNAVAFLDEQLFFDLLISKGLVDQFEEFCLKPGGDLYTFLFRTCGLMQHDVAPAIRYEVSVGDALDAGHSLKDICRFMRDTQGRAYVPGSSVKGAIRTALLYQAMASESCESHMPEKELPEWRYLHLLNLNQRNARDSVNSIMRGVQISDSEPIDDRLLSLFQKHDSSIEGNTHAINLCRECVVPGAAIRMRMTLDQSILKGRITAESIMNAINAFAAYGEKTYAPHFNPPLNHVPLGRQNTLYIGGGAGFFTKSMAYPYLGEQRGLAYTSDYLARVFRKHYHERDRVLGISPRTLKYGKFNRRLYGFGACEVSIK